jgi:hypothetical protein
MDVGLTPDLRLGIGRAEEVNVGAATHNLGNNTQIIAVEN